VGYLVIRDPERRSVESDTKTCVHCGGVWEVKSTDPARAEEGRFCERCHGLACPRCAHLGCTPLMREIERQERRQAFLRAVQ
jgi:hypothetical protein